MDIWIKRYSIFMPIVIQQKSCCNSCTDRLYFQIRAARMVIGIQNVLLFSILITFLRLWIKKNSNKKSTKKLSCWVWPIIKMHCNYWNLLYNNSKQYGPVPWSIDYSIFKTGLWVIIFFYGVSANTFCFYPCKASSLRNIIVIYVY